jgi:hypothetical protein
VFNSMLRWRDRAARGRYFAVPSQQRLSAAGGKIWVLECGDLPTFCSSLRNRQQASDSQVPLLRLSRDAGYLRRWGPPMHKVTRLQRESECVSSFWTASVFPSGLKATRVPACKSVTRNSGWLPLRPYTHQPVQVGSRNPVTPRGHGDIPALFWPSWQNANRLSRGQVNYGKAQSIRLMHRMD